MDTKKKVYAGVVLSMVFWGMTFVWTKIVLKYWNPLTIILIRLILSSAIIFGFLKLFYKIEKIQRNDYGIFFLSALFNPFLYFIGENYGLKYSSATLSAVIISTIPIFTAIAARIIYKERLALLNVVGMIISMGGILLMLNDKGFSFSESGRGILWLWMAVFSAVGYGIILKHLTGKYAPATIVAVQNFMGIFLFLPPFFLFEYTHFIQTPITSELLINLFFLAIFGSSLAFILFTIGTRELGLSRTSLFSNLIPFFTAATSFLLLGEQFTAIKILGMVAVIGGVVMTQLKKGEKSHHT
ncbi:MAG: hypothetical protein CSA95_06155 [Bacteroidetes bacterium]|nr:MAG: hypothetical protein CSA95_06155 [Bacteroidota bacterium]